MGGLLSVKPTFRLQKGGRTQPSGNFARLALYEQVDPLVLLEQFTIEFILEASERLRFVLMTRDCSCLRLVLCRADFDEMLDFVVINVISRFLVSTERYQLP